MARNTSYLGLYCKDPIDDGNDTFNIQTMLNDNWEKIDNILRPLNPKTGLSKYVSGRLEDYIKLSEKGVANGVATLGEDSKVPANQLPDMDYIPTSAKGAANGVATLGEDSKVPANQLPDMDYVKSSEKGAANGVATLGSDGKVPTAQLPSVDSFKIELTSYTGSGTSGERGKTSIGPFQFEPKIVFVLSGSTTAFFPIWRTSGTERQTIVHFPYEMSVNPGDNKSYHIPISYNIVKKPDKYYYLQAFNSLDGANASEFQFNDSETSYTAIAIG